MKEELINTQAELVACERRLAAAEQERDTMRLCSVSVTRTAEMLKVERDQANERAANLAAELAAMTLSRDQARQEAKDWKTKLAVERFRVQALVDKNFVLATRNTDCDTALRLERQEADTLRRQVRVLAHAYAGAAECTRCKGKPLCSNLTIRPMPCNEVMIAWTAQQAKEAK